MARRAKSTVLLRDFRGDTEISNAVQRLGQLAHHAAGSFERLTSVPQRASCTVAGELQLHGAVALGEAASSIDAKKTGTPFIRRPLQRRKAMRHLLKAGAEAHCEQVQVVPKFFCRSQEGTVWQHKRAGKIVLEADPGRFLSLQVQHAHGSVEAPDHCCRHAQCERDDSAPSDLPTVPTSRSGTPKSFARCSAAWLSSSM